MMQRTRERGLAALAAIVLLGVGCAYDQARLSYPALAALDRPVMVIGEVSAEASAYSGDVALGKALVALDAKARALQADDVADVRASVDTSWGLLRILGIPACRAQVSGKAIRYGEPLQRRD